MEGEEDEVVCDAPADGGADADFAADEEGEPEGEHRGDEVYEAGFPVCVEGAEGHEDVPDCGDDDGGERGFGDPVQRRAELVDTEDHDAAGDEAVCGRFDAAVRVHRGARHGATHGHGREEGVEEVGRAQIYKLLRGVDSVVILPAKGFGNGEVFDCSGDEGCDGTREDFGDQRRRRNFWWEDAVGLDF